MRKTSFARKPSPMPTPPWLLLPRILEFSLMLQKPLTTLPTASAPSNTRRIASRTATLLRIFSNVPTSSVLLLTQVSGPAESSKIRKENHRVHHRSCNSKRNYLGPIPNDFRSQPGTQPVRQSGGGPVDWQGPLREQGQEGISASFLEAGHPASQRHRHLASRKRSRHRDDQERRCISLRRLSLEG